MTSTADPSRPLRTTETLFRVLHLAASFGLIFAFSYVLGNAILSGPLQGNDSPLHVAYAEWLNQYFPFIPHWYPVQGGGESLLHGYPIAPHYGVVVLHRISGLSILQAYRLISFLTFPIAAFGVYLFVWDAFKRQTAGLIAAFLYLLAPVTWTWMFDWGFFSQQVAFVFLPLGLLAFSRTLRAQLDERRNGRRRLWFVATALVLIASGLCHLIVAVAATVGMGLVTVFGSLLATGSERAKQLRGGIKILILLAISVGLALAAYVVPFYLYGGVANREGLNTPPVHQLHRLPMAEFFGLRQIDGLEILTRMQFPLIVTVLAAVGLVPLILQWRRGVESAQVPLAYGLTAGVAVFFALTPATVGLILRVSSLLFNFLNFRSMLLLVMVLFPAIAGYGISNLTAVLLRPRTMLTAGDPEAVTNARTPAGVISRWSTAGLALVFAAGGTLSAWNWTSGSALQATYGPLYKGLDFTDPWNRAPADEAGPGVADFAPSMWPELELRSDDPTIANSQRIAAMLPEADALRIDVSPHEGRLAMDLAGYAGASQINSYTFQISLVHLMWGYQQNVFFSEEPPVAESGNPTSLTNVAKWFGVDYVVLDPDNDPVGTYQQAGWTQHADIGGAEIWRNPEPTGLATVTTRKAVLVIGKPETDAYMTIYRIANDGILPYEDALLVEGRSRVDDYTLDELALFDAVVLYGHDYRNSARAWALLESYVADGGGLFMDTGWEFWIPEWEFDPAPAVFPVSKALWTDYGTASDFQVGDPLIAGELDLSGFKPLVWEGQPWMLSGASADDIREWGRPVLGAGGRPLIVAGEYGQGRVVWSGMNLLGHARYGDPSSEELKLFGNLVRWSAENGKEHDLGSPTVVRDHPDRVHLQFSTVPSARAWLYWREAFYPNWNAYLVDSNGEREIPIYRGGPGFMLMPVESNDSLVSVTLKWELPLVEQIAIAASLAGGFVLLALTVDGLVLRGDGATWLKIAVFTRIPRPFLGEGANQEWAARKREELRRRAGDHSGLELGEAIPWMRSEAASTADGDNNQTRQADGAGLDLTPQADEQSLIESWLESSGHAEDGWAEKLLSERKKPRGP